MTTGIGEALRAARRQQGRSLADAAAATRVRESYLAALEEEEFAALGGDVYVKGFLRSYAKYLALDPEPLLEVYRRDIERTEDPAQMSLPAGPPLPPDERPGLPPLALAGAVVFVLLALFMLFNRGGGEEPTVPAPAPVEDSSTPVVELTSEPVATETATVDGTATATASPSETLDPNAPAEPAEPRSETVTVEGDRLRVRIVIDEPGSAVRVTSDGTLRADREMDPGTDLIFEANETIEFRIANAAAVRLVANGEPQGELGGEDEVVTIRFVLAS